MASGGKNLQILMVTSLFAPEIGGVCAVAEALASNLSRNIAVAAQRQSPASAAVDWSTYDRQFDYPVHRVEAYVTAMPGWIPRKLRGPIQFAFNILWTRSRAAASLLKFIEKHPLDVVCINTIDCYWLPAKLKRRFPKLKVIFYLHGEEISGASTKRVLHRFVMRALQASDAVVVVSRFTRDLAMDAGVAPEKICILNNGVDTSRFSPGAPDAELIKRFALTGKKVLLCLARLDARKGQDILIEAMPEILAASPKTVLLLVGGGAEEGRLRSLSKGLGLDDHVLFAGVASDEEVVRYYRTADVYAMPNRTTDTGDTEGFGLVFLEAGACAKPVIGGRAGGVPDAIVDGTTGYLVDGRSPQDVAGACIRLLSDATLADRFGRNGLSHSQQNTWQNQARKFLALCECSESPCVVSNL